MRRRMGFVLFLAAGCWLAGLAFADELSAPAVPSQESVTLETLDLKDIESADVWKMLSRRGQINIVAAADVKNRITIFLRNVSVEQTVDMICRAYGWAWESNAAGAIFISTLAEYERRSGTAFGQGHGQRTFTLYHVRVEPVLAVLNQLKTPEGRLVADERSGLIMAEDIPSKLDEMALVIARMDVPVKNRTFALNYGRVEDLEPKIREFLTPGIGVLSSDPHSNTLLISETDRNLTRLAAMIASLDRKPQEVLIEAKMVQVVLDEAHKIGVNWEAILRDVRNLRLQGNFSILGPNEKKGTISAGVLDRDDFTALIELLATVGKTNILSSPRITVINRAEAKILIGSTEPYVTSTTTTTSAGPVTTSESVNFIDVGVKLYVTPTIHDDRFVTVKIKPEVSSVVGQVVTASNNTIPVIEASEAETVVTVKDGATIVIGGLMKEEDITQVKKVPVLGDIPVLGFAFRNKSRSKKKTEIIIFLTPKIVAGD
jgi:type II secretory pathway component GspD/PulD (secretin)